MVDVDLLHGIYLTGKGCDSTHWGIKELQQVTQLGTPTNRAKAYHQLAQTYLKGGEVKEAEIMLDSLQHILNRNDLPLQILHINYEPILDLYIKTGILQKNY